MLNNLTDLNRIKELMSRYGVTFSKGLGQNFLINPSVCPRMAESCGSEDGVIEIGPGVGVLTRELSAVFEKVVSLELDKRLLPLLQESLGDCENVKIINGDIMKADLKSLIYEEFGGKKAAVCANLPYYITSPVIMRLLEERLPISTITVMVQKEAADRLCALPGTRACGAISAAVRYYCEPEILFGVSRGSFVPAPKVDSAVIRLNVLENPPVKALDEKAFFKLVKAAFGQRRKTALNAVSAGLSLKKDEVQSAMERAGIAPNIRAEAMSLGQLCDFSNELIN